MTISERTPSVACQRDFALGSPTASQILWVRFRDSTRDRISEIASQIGIRISETALQITIRAGAEDRARARAKTRDRARRL